MTAPEGSVTAVSRPFVTETGAVAGITAVGEHAGVGHDLRFLRGRQCRRRPLSDDLADQCAEPQRGLKIGFPGARARAFSRAIALPMVRGSPQPSRVQGRVSSYPSHPQLYARSTVFNSAIEGLLAYVFI